MATYFVDFSTSHPGTGHRGNIADPLSFDDFIAIQAASGGHTFYAKGYRSAASTSINNNNSFVLDAWDLEKYGPWRLYLAVFNGYYNQFITNGVLSGPAWWIRSNTNNMFFTAAPLTFGNFLDITCQNCVIHTPFSNTNFSGICSLENCVITSGSPWTVALNAGCTLTVDSNCVTNAASSLGFVLMIPGSTFVDNGITYGATLSAAPALNSTNLISFALGSTAGLNDSWAARTTTFYVDISSSSTGNPGHYADAPMGWTDFTTFLSGSALDGDTYKLKGTRSLSTSTTLSPAGTGVSVDMESWDPKTNGPWRLNNTSSTTFGASGKNINVQGGIIKSSSTVTFRGDDINVDTCHVDAGTNLQVQTNTAGRDIYLRGCTLVAGGYLRLSPSSDVEDSRIRIYNSALDIPYARGRGTADATLHPILNAVLNNGDGTYTAYFGWINNTGSTQNISVGASNTFSPSPSDRGQSTTFQVGQYRDVFSITWDGSTLTWTLSGKSVTASATRSIPSYTPSPGYAGAATLQATVTVIDLVNDSTSAASATIFNANSGSSSKFGYLATSGSEWGTTWPDWPKYTDERFYFYYSKILEDVGVSGTGSYSGYSTGLWGETRTGIGAVAYERILYFDIDISNDGSRSDGTSSSEPANYYELIENVNLDQGVRFKIRGARDAEGTHKDLFTRQRLDLWGYKYVNTTTQWYVYNEYILNTSTHTLTYRAPSANTWMRELISGTFDIIMDTNLNGTTNSFGFLISDPNIAPGSVYPYVMVTIDGTNATATYVDATPTTTTVNSALIDSRVLLRLRRVESGSNYTYYFQYHKNLRATYSTSGWTTIWSTTLTTSQMSANSLTLYLERGTTGSAFHSIEIKAEEGLSDPVEFNTVGNNYAFNILEAWDIENYGPWRLKTYALLGQNTSINDAIIYSTSPDFYDAISLGGSTLPNLTHTNTNFMSDSSGFIMSSPEHVLFKGVTIWLPGGDIYLQDSKPYPYMDGVTLTSYFFDDFDSSTWNPFWNSTIQSYFKLDYDKSRIEANNTSSTDVYFLTLGTTVSWIYSAQIYTRSTINLSHGLVFKINGSEYQMKWFSDQLNMGGPGMTVVTPDLRNDTFTSVRIKAYYMSSSNFLAFYFSVKPRVWVYVGGLSITPTSSVQFGLDLGYDSTLDEGNGLDWVYIQSSDSSLPYTDGFNFEVTSTDSSIGSLGLIEGGESLTKFNSSFNAFVNPSPPTKGTNTDYIVNWVPATQPSWDEGYIDSTTAPTPDAWSYLALKGTIPLGFGSDSYTDYDTGLFGFERYGIGAYYFPSYALNFISTPNPGYTNEDITFTPVNDGSATDWRWDFESDGSVDSTNRIGYHAYNFDSIEDQFYIATLSILGPMPETVTGIVGVRNRLDFEIYSSPDFSIGFPASDTCDIGITGWTRHLDLSSLVWDIELDSLPYTSISGVTGLSLNFTEGGIYSIYLTASDCGVTGMPGYVQEATASTSVKILNLAIDINPNYVSVGDTVTYQVTGGDVAGHTFRWRFGDSNYADGTSVSHQYLSGGVYDIELVIDRGTPDEITLTYDVSRPSYSELRVYVSDLDVNFSVDSYEGYPPFTAAFSDASSSSLGLTGWEWFFNGAGGSPENIGETGPIHVYPTSNVYYPVLRVTDLGGIQGVATGVITVYNLGLDIKTYQGSSLLPEPVFVESPTILTFVPNVTDESFIMSWKWELIYDDITYGEIILADQTTSVKTNFTHNLTVPEEYIIRLTVTDNYGRTYSRDEIITVTEDISIFATPTSGNYPLLVNFAINNVQTVDPYRTNTEWDFTDDGLYEVDALVTSYTYSAINTYTCRLKVIWKIVDKYSIFKTKITSVEKTTTISVSYPSFALSMGVVPSSGRKPLSSVLTGYANNPVSTWNWSINGTALPETTQQVSYTFTEAGLYLVALTATDTFGQGPLTVQGIVRVSDNISTVDEAVDPEDPTSLIELVGSAEIFFYENGVGFSIPAGTLSVSPSGFSSDKGITIIFE